MESNVELREVILRAREARERAQHLCEQARQARGMAARLAGADVATVTPEVEALALPRVR